MYGSLAMTGKGHATDIAVLLGLLGEAPDTVDPDRVEEYVENIKNTGQLNLAKEKLVPFNKTIYPRPLMHDLHASLAFS